MTSLEFREHLRGRGKLYHYTKLESVQGQIRLLTVRPGRAGGRLDGIYWDGIECSLKTEFLSNEPSYEALSYVWGDDSRHAFIKVDDKAFMVTLNLFLALRRLRDENNDRVMWVDAICINQEDNHEKSTQVAMMNKIFSACTRTILWLGEEPSVNKLEKSIKHWGPLPPGYSPPQKSEHATRALELLRMLGTNKHLDEMPCFSMTQQEPRMLIANPDYTLHFQALQDMMNEPWWTRIWVVQETVLSKKATIAFASETCSFSVLDDFYKVFSKHTSSCCKLSSARDNDAPSSLLDIVTRCGPLVQLREDWARGKDVRMSDLRSEFWSYQATKKRDLFYGLLGLVKYPRTQISEPAMVRMPVANYEVPESEAIAGACFEDIRLSRTLDILLGFRWQEPTGGLPSWIPDMHDSQCIDSTRKAQIQRERYLRRRYFSAAPPELQTDVQLINKRTLRVQSILVSRIVTLGNRVSMSSTAFGPWLEIFQWMDMVGITHWPDLAPERGSLEDSFWRALIHDGADLPLMLTDSHGQAKEDNYERMRDFLRSVLHDGQAIKGKYRHMQDFLFKYLVKTGTNKDNYEWIRDLLWSVLYNIQETEGNYRRMEAFLLSYLQKYPGNKDDYERNQNFLRSVLPNNQVNKDNYWRIRHFLRSVLYDGQALKGNYWQMPTFLLKYIRGDPVNRNNYTRMRDLLPNFLPDGFTCSDWDLPKDFWTMEWDLPKDFWLMTTCTNNLTESALAVTAEGRLAIVPASSNIGDEIHVLPGSRLPYVLCPRRTLFSWNDLTDFENPMSELGTPYKVIGDCYLHGSMHFRGSADDMPGLRLIDLH